MSALPAVTDATFAAEVLASPKPVLVDYWADWCAPCRQLTPIVAQFAEEYGDRVKFVALDANTNTAVPMTYNVNNLPTIQVFQGGQIVASLTGNVTKIKLRQMLDDVA
ncbi:MAG: thioredoxin fold domain-containing protein [Propionibacteriaceae bacterium]|jgi:thioredoxin 1|nr:thioredoxin fold domain-containing protein [Propionibacteriaceae bacterium]